MKKLLLSILGVCLLVSMCFATATNFRSTGRTTYTTAETTITFPYRTQAITIVNFDASNVLMVSYQGQTAEVDPLVNPVLSLEDVMFSSLNIRYKTGTGEAQVISLH